MKKKKEKKDEWREESKKKKNWQNEANIERIVSRLRAVIGEEKEAAQ